MMRLLKTLNRYLGICLFVCGAAISSEDPDAGGYEARFMRGVLVYKPNPGSDVGRIDFPIAGLANPLEGTFDLSRCGDAARYISIHTGYKKRIIEGHRDGVEIWVCPKFLVERELETTARHFAGIMDRWESPIAYFWTWGNHDVGSDNYDYLLNTELCMSNEKNLYEKWDNVPETSRGMDGPTTYLSSPSMRGAPYHPDPRESMYFYFEFR